jgi:NADH-quinone oxidoreductase subunit A
MQFSGIDPYAAIGVCLLVVIGLAGVMLILAHTVGPRRHGPVKDSPYESGVLPIADARRRFHVRFYMIAVLFLLFDVEVIFLWPWAQVFHAAATTGRTIPLDGGGVAGKGFLLLGMGMFFALLIFGLIYEWRKGALSWE